MKKLLYAAIAAIGLLLSPACSNEDELSNDNEALVSFNVGVENGMQTKAIADGSKATVLKVRVFEDGTTEGTIKELTAFQQNFSDFNGTKDNIQFSLLKGKKYYFLFWAEAATSPYTIKSDGTITVNYTGAKCNDETRDAFVGVYECVAQTTINQSITLTRPFAQLNFLTSEDDIKAAAAGKIVNDIVSNGLSTKVTINNAATSYNPFTKKVSGSTTATFGVNKAPFTVANNGTGTAASNYTVTADNGTVTISTKTYHYLASVYFLVNTGDGQDAMTQTTLSSAKLEVDGTDYTPLEVNNPNVQQNYRTNIYGSLLTDPGKFTVTINPVFDGTENQEHIVSITKDVSTYDDFIAALRDNTVNKIVLKSNIQITSNVEISRDVTIDGGESKWAFTKSGYSNITIASDADVNFTNISFANRDYSLSATDYAGTLNITNCNFYVDGDNAASGSINLGVTNGANITIDGNTFQFGYPDEFAGPGVAPKTMSQYLKIIGAENCTATVKVVNNNFKDGSHLGEMDMESIGSSYILTLKNLSASNTTIGKNNFADEASRISISFYGKAGLTAEDFKTTFTDQSNEKTVSEI